MQFDWPEVLVRFSCCGGELRACQDIPRVTFCTAGPLLSYLVISFREKKVSGLKGSEIAYLLTFQSVPFKSSGKKDCTCLSNTVTI